MLSNLIQQKWRTAAEGENCMKYVNSYLMNCTMNIFEALSREINLDMKCAMNMFEALSREINLNCHGV